MEPIFPFSFLRHYPLYCLFFVFYFSQHHLVVARYPVSLPQPFTSWLLSLNAQMPHREKKKGSIPIFKKQIFTSSGCSCDNTFGSSSVWYISETCGWGVLAYSPNLGSYRPTTGDFGDVILLFTKSWY